MNELFEWKTRGMEKIPEAFRSYPELINTRFSMRMEITSLLEGVVFERNEKLIKRIF